jgi:hypothetical protein
MPALRRASRIGVANPTSSLWRPVGRHSGHPRHRTVREGWRAAEAPRTWHLGNQRSGSRPSPVTLSRSPGAVGAAGVVGLAALAAPLAVEVAAVGALGAAGDRPGRVLGLGRMALDVAGRLVRWRAAATARWRTVSGFRVGMPRPWRVKACAATARWCPAGGGVHAAQLLGQRIRPLGFGAVGEEAAGLPAHSLLGMQGPTGWRRRGLDQHSAVD